MTSSTPFLLGAYNKAGVTREALVTHLEVGGLMILGSVAFIGLVTWLMLGWPRHKSEKK